MRPYLIVSHDYTRKSAGVRALHRLANDIHAHFGDAYVTGSTAGSPYANAAQADPDLAREIAQNGIVVYPEVEKGNPLNAGRIVRFVLNIPGLIRPTEFTENEITYAYCGLLSKHLRCDPKIFTIPVTPQAGVFTPLVGPLAIGKPSPTLASRSGVLWWGGKSGRKGHEPPVPGATEITLDWPETWETLADRFKRATVFYSYAPYTNLLVEARLCDCPCVIVPNDWWTKEEYAAGAPHGMDGIAWGTSKSEITHAFETADVFYQRYDIDCLRYWDNLVDFLEFTQEAFR